MCGADSKVRGQEIRRGRAWEFRAVRADVTQRAASSTTLLDLDPRGHVHDSAAEGDWVSRYRLERKMQAVGFSGTDWQSA